jgi:parvulin-like peptidyl-prolyl isomerase
MFFNLLFLLSLVTGQTTVDAIVATVNDTIICQSDVEKYQQLFPVFRASSETTDHFFNRVLETLIDVRIVDLENLADTGTQENDINLEQTIITRVGSIEQLLQILHQYNMEWNDFKAFIREHAVYERVLREKYASKVTIPFTEIESFYQTEYVPVQKQLKLEPRSLAEMAPLLGQYLRQTRMLEKLEQWLKELKSSYRINIKTRSNG